MNGLFAAENQQITAEPGVFLHQELLIILVFLLSPINTVSP
jgi:hypothetical protein